MLDGDLIFTLILKYKYKQYKMCVFINKTWVLLKKESEKTKHLHFTLSSC